MGSKSVSVTQAQPSWGYVYAEASWTSTGYVTVTITGYRSYFDDGTTLSWRIRGRSPDTTQYTYGNVSLGSSGSFQGTLGKDYVFQIYASGAPQWANDDFYASGFTIDGSSPDPDPPAPDWDYVAVTYDDNGGSGGPGTQWVRNIDIWVVSAQVPTRSASGTSETTTFTIRGQSGVSGVEGTSVTATKVTRPGYTFAGWNNSQDGTGNYTVQPEQWTGISITQPVKLWAKWTPTENATYTNNKVRDLPLPDRPSTTDTEHYYITGHSTSDAEYTQLKCNKHVETSYTFNAWKSPGGDTFSSDSDVEFTEATTLTATWESSTQTSYSNNTLKLLPIPDRRSDENSRYYIITGNANGGDSDTELEAAYIDITNYQFVGWGNAGSDIPIDLNTSYNVPADVYAIWSSSGDLGYRNNTLNLLPVPTRSDEVKSTDTVTLLLNGGYLEEGSNKLYSQLMASYEFSSWNTNSQGTGQTLPSTYEFLQASEVYAIWTSSSYKKSVMLPIPLKRGSVFKGWKTENSVLQPGEYTPIRSITLTAIWQEQGSSYIDGELYIACYDTGTEWVILTPCYDTGTEWVN